MITKETALVIARLIKVLRFNHEHDWKEGEENAVTELFAFAYDESPARDAPLVPRDRKVDAEPCKDWQMCAKYFAFCWRCSRNDADRTDLFKVK